MSGSKQERALRSDLEQVIGAHANCIDGATLIRHFIDVARGYYDSDELSTLLTEEDFKRFVWQLIAALRGSLKAPLSEALQAPSPLVPARTGWRSDREAGGGSEKT